MELSKNSFISNFKAPKAAFIFLIFLSLFLVDRFIGFVVNYKEYKGINTTYDNVINNNQRNIKTSCQHHGDMDVYNEYITSHSYLTQTFDSYGFKNTTDNFTKKIIIVGDSFGNSTGATDKYTIQAVINKTLNKNIAYSIAPGTPFDVFEYNIKDYEPKIVIFIKIERMINQQEINAYRLKEKKAKLTLEINQIKYDSSFIKSFLEKKSTINITNKVSDFKELDNIRLY